MKVECVHYMCFCICTCKVVSISNLSDCKAQHEVDVDFPGTDITSVYSPDADHCQQLCTQHPSCLFFTFIRGNWTRDNRYRTGK